MSTTPRDESPMNTVGVADALRNLANRIESGEVMISDVGMRYDDFTNRTTLIINYVPRAKP